MKRAPSAVVFLLRLAAGCSAAGCATQFSPPDSGTMAGGDDAPAPRAVAPEARRRAAAAARAARAGAHRAAGAAAVEAVAAAAAAAVGRAGVPRALPAATAERGRRRATAGTPAPPRARRRPPCRPATPTPRSPSAGTTRQYIVHVPSELHREDGRAARRRLPPNLARLQLRAAVLGVRNQGRHRKASSSCSRTGSTTPGTSGPCCTTSRTVDDVGFSRALIAKIESEACIDTKRVYAVGYSMGGGMAMDIACNAADIIAAIAPAAFDLMDPSNEWPCNPSRPITVISFRSTGDPVVPYAGGPTNPPNGLPITITFLGAVGTFQKWASARPVHRFGGQQFEPGHRRRDLPDVLAVRAGRHRHAVHETGRRPRHGRSRRRLVDAQELHAPVIGEG